jgi:hypothetical protein
MVESESLSVSESEALAHPLFVVGAERSGSTLLRLMLDHHPRISCPHQLEFAVDRLGDDGRWPDVDAYRAWLQQDGIFLRSGFAIDAGLDYRRLVDGFLLQRSRGRPVVGGSVHRHFGRLLQLWPGARMIHILRDPRAVARSVVTMGWAGNAWAGARRWVVAELDWDRVCERLEPERRHEVRYEDLVRQPEETLRGVCAFLGLAYDEAMLSYPQDSTYSAPSPERLGRWREELSPAEQALVDARVGALLLRRGYPPCGHEARPPGPLRRALLGLDDKRGRIEARVRRYGLPLYLQDLVVRRLGPERARRAVGKRLLAVDNARVK